MGIFNGFGNITGQQQPNVLGGGMGQLPRVPYAQNQAITMAALGMLGAPTLNEGMRRAAPLAVAGMGANRDNQLLSMQMQEKAATKAEQDRRNAAINAWVLAQSDIPLSPEQSAAIAANPELGSMLFGESLKAKLKGPEKPTVVGKDSVLYNEATGEWITPPGGGAPDPASITNITAIRKDLEDEQGTSRYRTAAPILSSMAKSVDDPSSMADLDFVYGMAKIFDPGSVVRESEMGLVIDSQSMPATIKGRLEKILNGEAVLQPQARRDLVRAAATRVQEYRTQAESEGQFFTDLAKRNKIDPLDVVRPLEPMTSAPGVYTWSPETGLVIAP